jgi:hypothetical protein
MLCAKCRAVPDDTFAFDFPGDDLIEGSFVIYTGLSRLTGTIAVLTDV